MKAHADDLYATATMLASLGWPFPVRRPDELRASLRKVADVVSAAAGMRSAEDLRAKEKRQ